MADIPGDLLVDLAQGFKHNRIRRDHLRAFIANPDRVLDTTELTWQATYLGLVPREATVQHARCIGTADDIYIVDDAAGMVYSFSQKYFLPPADGDIKVCQNRPLYISQTEGKCFVCYGHQRSALFDEIDRDQLTAVGGQSCFPARRDGQNYFVWGDDELCLLRRQKIIYLTEHKSMPLYLEWDGSRTTMVATLNDGSANQIYNLHGNPSEVTIVDNKPLYKVTESTPGFASKRIYWGDRDWEYTNRGEIVGGPIIAGGKISYVEKVPTPTGDMSCPVIDHFTHVWGSKRTKMEARNLIMGVEHMLSLNDQPCVVVWINTMGDSIMSGLHPDYEIQIGLWNNFASSRKVWLGIDQIQPDAQGNLVMVVKNFDFKYQVCFGSHGQELSKPFGAISCLQVVEEKTLFVAALVSAKADEKHSNQTVVYHKDQSPSFNQICEPTVSDGVISCIARRGRKVYNLYRRG